MFVRKLVSCKTGNWDRWSGGRGRCAVPLPSIKSGSLKFRSGRRLLSHFLKQSIENGKGDILRYEVVLKLCSCSFPCFSATWFVFKESFCCWQWKHIWFQTKGKVHLGMFAWKLGNQARWWWWSPLLSTAAVRLLYPGKVENGSCSNDLASY